MAKRTKYRTEVGTLGPFAYIQKPDMMESFDDAKPVYKASVMFDPKDIEEIRQKADELLDQHIEQEIENAKGKTKGKLKNYNKSLPIEEEVDEDGEPTGKIEVKFRQNYEINGEPVKFRVVDAKRNPLPKDIRPSDGSKVKVAFTMRPYTMHSSSTFGVRFDMFAVQVIELAEWEPDDPFEEEDGFIVEEEEEDEFEDEEGDELTTDGEEEESYEEEEEEDPY